jgi:hypothetical protein
LIEALAFNEKIFKHPPVQVHPPGHSHPGAGHFRDAATASRCGSGRTERSMEEGLSRQPYPLPTTPIDFNERVLVLVTGGQVEEVKYRAHTVYLVGKRVPGSYHLFTLTRRYFYKQRLHFAFFIHSGERLAWDNIVLSRKP